MRRHHTTKDVNNPVISPFFDYILSDISRVEGSLQMCPPGFGLVGSG